MKTILTMSLEEVYLSWVNDFLTIPVFAEHYGTTLTQATYILEAARDAINNNNFKGDK